MASKAIPFEFVLEAIGDLNPRTRPMFGCTAVYVDLKIVFILRDKEDHSFDNGVWLATTVEYHESLRKDFPSMRSIKLFDSGGPTGWQNLPSDAPDFESAVLKACEFVMKKDLRIGKIPASKSLSSKKKKKSEVDAYIKKFPTKVQSQLKKMRKLLLELVPKAEEVISYGIPTIKLNGTNLVHFAAFKNHIGFYPTSSGVKKFKKELTKYESSKGAIRFPLADPLPAALIKKITKFRISEVEQQ